jgi:hypothetical protein
MGRSGTAVLAVTLLAAGGGSGAAESVVRFEPARPVRDGGARFVARGAGHAVLLDRQGPALLVGGPRPAVVRMTLVGARATEPVALAPLASTSNHLIGRDPRRWRLAVPHYGRVEYPQVYAGIDLAVHGDGQRLEYDFVVAPGTDPRRVRLRFDGARRVRIEADGRLILQTAAGDVVQQPPVAYQDGPQGREPVASAYRRLGPREVAFAVGEYDRRRTLVIDPVLEYSTYLGGGGSDGVTGIAVDAQGNRYLAGFTLSGDFPTARPLQPGLAGGSDVFVAKLNAQGSELLYSTFLGGSGTDQAQAIAVDAAGSVHVAGFTESSDFPVVAAVQGARKGGRDAFVARLDPSGAALLYSTYLGGSQHDVGESIALTPSGDATVAGWTESTDFPLAGPLQGAFGGGITDAFVATLAAAGSTLGYSTFLGGEHADRAFGVAVDAQGAAYVSGETASLLFPTLHAVQPARAGLHDAFVTKIDRTGSSMGYSTFLGGSADERAARVAVDAAGAAYVAGLTVSDDFPTLRGFQHGKAGLRDSSDGFVTKLMPAGAAIVYSTYLGGSRNETVNGVAVDARGHAYVAGETSSMDFPQSHALMAATGVSDAFVTRLDADGRRLVYSTCFGGAYDAADSAVALALEGAGAVNVAGRTEAPDLPRVHALQSQYAGLGDAFLARIAGDPLTWGMAVDTVPSAASNGNGVLEVGETVDVATAWRNELLQPLATPGTASSFLGPGGLFARYSVDDSSARFDTIAPGETGTCVATGDCYRIGLAIIGLRRRFHWDASFRELLNDTGTFVKRTVHVGETFADVPRDSPYAASIETLVHLGATGGCVSHGEIFCPEKPMTRAQMAVLVAASRDRPGFVPTPCAAATLFADVPSSSPFCPWVESLARRGVLAGCGGGSFCPGASVLREQMPVFILAALEGRGYRPPPCAAPRFADVPASSPFCPWIEELARRGGTAGCGGGNYCPQAPVTRQEGAAFVVAGFGLSLYGP